MHSVSARRKRRFSRAIPNFHELLDAFQENDEVALFSGGVDFFAGAVNDIVTLGKSVTLVGHWSVPKVQNVQATLVDALKQRGYGRRLSYVPVWVSNTDIKPAEYTQRTRSFLFACIGLVVARMSGKDGFSFYENGRTCSRPSSTARSRSEPRCSGSPRRRSPRRSQPRAWLT